MGKTLKETIKEIIPKIVALVEKKAEEIEKKN